MADERQSTRSEIALELHSKYVVESDAKQASDERLRAAKGLMDDAFLRAGLEALVDHEDPREQLRHVINQCTDVKKLEFDLSDFGLWLFKAATYQWSKKGTADDPYLLKP